MSDIKQLTPGPRRGGRRHRKHHSHDQTRTEFALVFTKWSGLAAASVNGGSSISYLADVGSQIAASTTPPSYPFLGSRQPRSLTVNLLGFTVPVGGLIVAELLNNGITVPGFVITYGPGQTGIQSVAFNDKPYVKNSTFDVKITTSGLFVASVPLSATVQGIRDIVVTKTTDHPSLP